GIRDRNVTGVQTCALPISGGLPGVPGHRRCARPVGGGTGRIADRDRCGSSGRAGVRGAGAFAADGGAMSATTAQRTFLSRAGVVGGWVVRVGPWSLRVDHRLLLAGGLLMLVLLGVSILTLATGTIDLSVGEVGAAVFGEGDVRAWGA